MLLKTVILVIATLTCSESARILGVFPIAGKSHYILAHKLMMGLAEAGHDVTMVSSYHLKSPPKNGTFTDVVLDGYAEETEKLLKDLNLFQLDAKGMINMARKMVNMIYKSVNDTMQHPKLKALAASDQQFDVVLMEQFNLDAHKVYAHIFKCPLIILSSFGPNARVNALVGNPHPVSYAAHLLMGDFSKNLSLWNRTKNLLFTVIDSLISSLYIFPVQDQILHSIYPDAPPLIDLYQNVSLVLLNSHTSINPPLPLVPNMVEIGGYFIDPPKKLPKEFQEFLDNATEGVVYFSLGSNLKSKDLPEDRKQLFLNVLGQLKQKVIWKFEEELLPGKPPNVMITKWCPQQDILAHPNIKLFITHGGLLSTTETIYYGVPILAIPVFGDQHANAARAEADGYGLKLSYHDADFTEKKLRALINDLLTNPKYTETAKAKSIIYHDRPMKPMETAVYWIEYVIRHRGAPHLLVAGARLPWYKYLMLDVFGAIAVLIGLVVYITKIACRKLLNTFRKQKPKKLKSQ